MLSCIALKGQEYDVFIGDVRLWMPKKQIYTYPDVMLIEGKPEYYNRRTDTITNPQIIVEVLSKSTKAYDPGDKFRSYRTIPTFQEYILIEQTEIFIEQYSKTDNNKWSLSEYAAEDKMLELTSLQIQISLADIYNKVDFAVGD